MVSEGVEPGGGAGRRRGFVWVGNHPGLDFCNTVPVIGGSAVELLVDPDDLEEWLALAGAPPRLGDGVSNAATVEWAHLLRGALRRLLENPGPGLAGRGGGTEAASGAEFRQALNEVLAGVPAVAAVDDNRRMCLRPVGGAVGGTDPTDGQRRLDLAQLVVPAAALEPARVRRCANPACILLFFDTSKSGRRRWHDMATCGNRAKAASHYARMRGLPA